MWPSPLSDADDSDSHTALGRNCSTALAARSRQGREHAVNAVALIEEHPRDGNSAVSGGTVSQIGSKLATVSKNRREGRKKKADKNWVLSAYDESSADGDISAIATAN